MKVDLVLFCEDIRHEQNNKFSLMGVYTDRIIVKAKDPSIIKWPIPIRLACYIRVQSETADLVPDSFEFEYLINGKSFNHTVKGPFKVIPDQPLSTVRIVGEGVPIEKGTIGIRLKILSGQTMMLNYENQQGLIIEDAKE